MKKLSQWIRRKLSAKAVILHYHRVAELPTDPHRLCVTPDHFAEHLGVLGKFAFPMRLDQLVSSLRNQDSRHFRIVITFDDGYADNLIYGKPILERYDMPSTVFIATGYMNSDREFWWDELERILLMPGTLPETLHLRAQGKEYHWELGEAIHYSEEAFQTHRSWIIESANAPGTRQHLFRILWQLLHSMTSDERDQALQRLLIWSGAASGARPSYRTLSSQEVTRLAVGGLIEVGAHTVSHPVLSRLDVREQLCEIQGSKAQLEEILGAPVTSFSYPFGLQSDYTAETVRLVREGGFTCACSSVADIVWSDTDYFQLPRLLVRDWDGEEFARRLHSFFS
jgi:peptidoglycan/xylan/chitin deacetylase (PgdA/CDA1 family)